MKAECCQLVFLVLCLGSLGRFSEAISRPSSVVLENNEFKHILVAIDENVADDPTLIQKIKDAFTKASPFLYAATDKRAVFRDITILVPASWSNNNAYAKATSQVLVNADVIFTTPISSAPPPSEKVDESSSSVDAALGSGGGGNGDGSVVPVPPADNDATYNRPPAMTKAYAGCGHQGVRVILTTDILTNRALSASLGPPEKVLVHEWSHFRWGVFDEYAVDGEPQFYFSPSTGKLEGVRCTEIIQGIVKRNNPTTGAREYCRDLDPNTGLYPEGCTFLPYPAGPFAASVRASIMDHVNIRTMSKFCDDQPSNVTRHNYDAPSRHNRLCSHRSTWDVISNSQDFAHGTNPSRDGVDTAPVFNVVQAHTSKRMILALDTSASMAENQKLTRVKHAVATFVQDVAEPGTEVGLTTFSDEVHVHRAPRALKTPQDRQTFVDDLPDTQSGATDITLALTSAAQILHDSKPSHTVRTTTTVPWTASNSSLSPSHHAHGDHVSPSHSAMGAHVVVVTDGHETSGRSVTSALPMLRDLGVRVSFIVLGNTPQPDLQLLAQKTGGQIYYDCNEYSSTAATDAFFDILDTSGVKSTNSPIQILNQAKELWRGHSMDGEMYLDRALGNKTTFLVAYDVSVPTVSVTSPFGRVYRDIYSEYSIDHRLQLIRILIPGQAEFGKWTYKISNPGQYQRVSLLVLSSPSNSSVQPVKLSGMLIAKNPSLPTAFHIFAEATWGQTPVTGLTVIALVQKPDGSSEALELMDNGAGADIVENDGVYSRFYGRLSEPGVYTVQVKATGHAEHHITTAHIVHTSQPNQFVQRSASAGYVVIGPRHNHTTNDRRAYSGNGNDDKEAPVRISDLRVVKTCNKNRTVVLSWRAPGDDFDRDTASHYEMYIAPTAKDLMTDTNLICNLTQHDVVHGNLVAPKPFGTREYYMVRIPNDLPFPDTGSFVFTVVAADKAGNRGEHSNYVTVGLGKVPDVTDHKYWKAAQFQLSPTRLQAPHNERLLISLILGTVSGLLVLIIIVTVLVSFFTHKQNTQFDQFQNSYDLKDKEQKMKTNVFAMT